MKSKAKPGEHWLQRIDNRGVSIREVDDYEVHGMYDGHKVVVCHWSHSWFIRHFKREAKNAVK